MRAPFLGLFAAIIAILGLFLASGDDPGAFLGGMAFFAFGVAINFWLIARKEHGTAVPTVAAE